MATDEDKQRALYLRLKKKFDAENSNIESTIDVELAVCALQVEIDLSENSWTKLRFWIQDFIRRGGDINKLPSYRNLKTYKEKMIPKGLVSDAKVARVDLQVSISS